MDIQMPEMDGYQTTQAIRQLPQVTSQQPWIVAMTAYSNLEDQQRCLQVGMNDFLSKPITLGSLTERLVRFGQIQAPEMITQGFRPLSSRQPSVQGFHTLPPPVLDETMLSAIRDMAGAEADGLIQELVDNDREDATQSITRLRQAIADHNSDQVRHQTHALRSMSLNLGALFMGTLCQTLELQHQHMSLIDRQACLSQIEDAFAQVMLVFQTVIMPVSHD
jgi:CheY-like chemotaxis protein